MHYRKALIEITVLVAGILLFSSMTFSQELTGQYTRQKALKENWLELFWAYDNAAGWVDNVIVTRDKKVLLAENFDSNVLDDTVWTAQLPEEMFSVEDGALHVNKKAKNVTGIYAKTAFQPPFVVEADLKFESNHPRVSLVDEVSREGQGGTNVWWATEVSVGQDADGTVGVFSNGWNALGQMSLEDYNHYRIVVPDEKTAEVVITEGPGEPVIKPVEPLAKLATTWAEIKSAY